MKKGILIAGIVGIIVVVAVMLAIFVLLPWTKYNQAKAALQEGRHDEAIALFSALGSYRDSADMLLESHYGQAVSALENGSYDEAMEKLSALGDYRDSAQLCREAGYQKGLSLTEEGKYREALEQFSTVIEYEGAVDGIGKVYRLAAQGGQMGVAFDAAAALRDFEGIARLNQQVISAGRNHLVALRRDGTVVAAGKNDEGQCDVEGWTDIISVAAGYNYTLGLRADGTVVATGLNNNGQCDVHEWTDIVAIYAGNTATDSVGVKSDGSIVSTGSLKDKTYSMDIPSKMDGMLKVYPGLRGIIAVMEGGAVRYIKKAGGMPGIEDWMGVIDAAIGTGHAAGLLFDGTVATAGENSFGQNDVSEWTHIIAVSASNSNTAGLKTDGTVVVAGSNSKGQMDARLWSDMVALSVGPGFIAGLKIDGSVLVAGAVVGGTTQASVVENQTALETIAKWRGIWPAS